MGRVSVLIFGLGCLWDAAVFAVALTLRALFLYGTFSAPAAGRVKSVALT